MCVNANLYPPKSEYQRVQLHCLKAKHFKYPVSLKHQNSLSNFKASLKYPISLQNTQSLSKTPRVFLKYSISL